VKNLAVWIGGAVASLLASLTALSFSDSDPAWGALFGVFLFVGILAAFYVLASIFSDGVESRARWKILVVALAATLLLGGISMSTPTTLMGLVIACLVAAAVSLAGLMFWIKVKRLQALKITAWYIGFVIGYLVVVGLIFGPPAT
jgi:hypothetical protein